MSLFQDNFNRADTTFPAGVGNGWDDILHDATPSNGGWRISGNKAVPQYTGGAVNTDALLRPASETVLNQGVYVYSPDFATGTGPGIVVNASVISNQLSTYVQVNLYGGVLYIDSPNGSHLASGTVLTINSTHDHVVGVTSIPLGGGSTRYTATLYDATNGFTVLGMLQATSSTSAIQFASSQHVGVMALTGGGITQFVAYDTTQPPVMGTLTVGTGTLAGIPLTWTAAVGGALPYASYDIHRSLTTGFTPSSGTKVGTVAGNVLAYTDVAPDGQTYYYKVVVVDANGLSGVSNQVSGTQPVLSTTLDTVISYQAATGQTYKVVLYTLAWTSWNNVSHAIDTINAGNWTQHAISMVEQPGLGNYLLPLAALNLPTNSIWQAAVYTSSAVGGTPLSVVPLFVWDGTAIRRLPVTLGAGAITNASFAAGAIDANAIATDAIGANEIAVSAVSEIVAATLAAFSTYTRTPGTLTDTIVFSTAGKTVTVTKNTNGEITSAVTA